MKKKNHYEIPPGINSRFYKFSVDVKYSSSRKKTYNTSNRIVTRRSSTENASPPLFVAKKAPCFVEKKVSSASDDFCDDSQGRSQIQNSSKCHMGQRKDRNRKRSEGIQKPDLVVRITEPSIKNLFIFEIKRSDDFTNVHEGIAQLVSFGLSMQQQNKQTVYLHLVLITPKLWGFLVLPPCGMELEEPLEFRVILFYEDKKKRLVTNNNF